MPCLRTRRRLARILFGLVSLHRPWTSAILRRLAGWVSGCGCLDSQAGECFAQHGVAVHGGAVRCACHCHDAVVVESLTKLTRFGEADVRAALRRGCRPVQLLSAHLYGRPASALTSKETPRAS